MLQPDYPISISPKYPQTLSLIQVKEIELGVPFVSRVSLYSPYIKKQNVERRIRWISHKLQIIPVSYSILQ